MTSRRLSAFVDALAAGRRPKRFRATSQDVDVVRTAITLRDARPGEAAPADAFVEGLFQRLSDEASAETPRAIPATPRPRARVALVAAAAAAAVVAGTAAVTHTLTHSATTAPEGAALRTGTFQTAGGAVVGQVVVYRGHPSWVFMNVTVPNYEGRMVCRLRDANGKTAAVGSFTVHDGKGQWSKNVGGVDVSGLRGAELVDATGSSVGAATLAN